MALHEQCVGATDEWYTPPHVFHAMGAHFDLDVASPGAAVVPWIPASERLTRDSLTRPWRGLVWMNAPFGGRNALSLWLERFFDHGDGAALVPDRTSAPWWQRFVPEADLALFVRGKIKFIGTGGMPGASPAQGTTLIALGPRGCAALENAAAAGLGCLFEPRRLKS
jgi:hypothetical protein